MSVILYDEAFLQKLKNWTADTELNVFGVNDTKKLFSVIADKTDDRPINLPILCLQRLGGYKLLNSNRKPLTFDGIILESDAEKTAKINGIPINIEYQLDIYCRYYAEADEYVRNLIYNIINYPVLDVTIPYYEKNFIHNGVIRLAGDVEDNSDIPERLITGQFTRLSLNITIDDAYLWDIRIRNNKRISEIYVQTEKDPPELVITTNDN